MKFFLTFPYLLQVGHPRIVGKAMWDGGSMGSMVQSPELGWSWKGLVARPWPRFGRLRPSYRSHGKPSCLHQNSWLFWIFNHDTSCYIYIYGAALATPPHPPHQWVWVDSIVWFFWSPPLWPVVVVWFFWSPPPVACGGGMVLLVPPPPVACGGGMLVCWYVGMLACMYVMYVCM